jgi:hypothetical protein
MRREAGRMDRRRAVTDLTRFQELSKAIEQAQLLTRNAPQVAADPSNTPWMPFNLFDFAALLFEAVPLIPDDATLLEVGCGPGPNLVLARALGLDAYGIEVSAELAAPGIDAGLTIEVADALAYDGYRKPAAVWLNRPVRDRGREAALEQKIWREMAGGAVAICANLENRPPESWFIINDSWESLRRGAWVKPHAATEGWA